MARLQQPQNDRNLIRRAGRSGVYLAVAAAVLTALAGLPRRAEAQHMQFDVKNSTAGRRIADYACSLAPGNRGSAEIEELLLDATNREVRGQIKIVASHSWGSVNVPNPTASNPFGVKKIEIAASDTVTGRFRYNLETSRITGDVSLGTVCLTVSVAGRTYRKDFGEIRVDLERVERILQGDWESLVESIPNPGGVIQRERRNEYSAIRDSHCRRYGTANVYFASERFVNWASAERLARWGVELVITDGAAVQRIMKEVRQEASKELPDVTNWLTARGQQQARVVAAAILNGDRIGWPNLAVYWQTVKYESRVILLGRPVGPWIPVRHGAFVVTWQQGSSDGTAASVARRYWRYRTGYLTDEGQGRWVEFQEPRTTYRFVETARTAEFVELYDATRNYTVRLYADRMMLRGGRPGVPLYPDFAKMWDGRWER